MAGLPTPSAVSDVWPRGAGSYPGGPTPFGGGTTGLPTVNNSNLPLNTTTFLGNRPLTGTQAPLTPFPSIRQPTGFGNQPPPIPQPPLTPFPAIRQPTATTSNSLVSNAYPSGNPLATAIVQNQLQNTQLEAYQRRLQMLEDENALRRNATANLTQMGHQVLQGQMDVQEQTLQYQFMLEQCMEALDHQNYILNEQSEELALVQAKMRHFEYIMDALKLSKEGSNLMRNVSQDGNCIDTNVLCCRDPLALPPPSTSPFFTGTATRVTSSTFQPFNPRYRSPKTRAAAAATLNDRRSATPATTTPKPTANERPSRRFGNAR